ncbi:TOBE domain-containing protein [Pseudorhodoferax sp. LjRoot39]|uniref:TOBE domain-containing protein n=1 Tax=Pseudorhodoferax sp. LjRoot39 TaxID=3342328 RepID=UPI003ED01B95
MRPQAWRLDVPGGLPATLKKSAYLGGFYAYSFDTPLGSVFVVSTEQEQPLAPGAPTTLGLGQHGVAVVARPAG